MGNIFKRIAILSMLLSTSDVFGARCEEKNLTIDSIRAVGTFTSGPGHNKTLELHHSNRNWCGWESCAYKNRVLIQAEHTHLVSAVYLAFASGKTVDITIEDQLGSKGGICTVAFIDVNK